MLTKIKILQILQEKKEFLTQYGVKELGLFGSYSKKLQHKESDINILVDFISEQETFDNLMAINDVLEDAFSNYKIEIVTKKGLSKYLEPYILKETIYV